VPTAPGLFQDQFYGSKAAEVSLQRSSPRVLLGTMARVTRAAVAAANRRSLDANGGGVTAEAREALDMYPSISSLRSIQVEEEESNMSFQELTLAGEIL